MTMPISASAARIARDVRTAEEKFDEVLLASAKLMETLVTARQHPGVQVHAGQKALIRLVRAQQNIVDGSSDMFRVHDELAELGRVMGIMDERDLTEGSGLKDADRSRAA